MSSDQERPIVDAGPDEDEGRAPDAGSHEPEDAFAAVEGGEHGEGDAAGTS